MPLTGQPLLKGMRMGEEETEEISTGAICGGTVFYVKLTGRDSSTGYVRYAEKGENQAIEGEGKRPPSLLSSLATKRKSSLQSQNIGQITQRRKGSPRRFMRKPGQRAGT